MGPIHLKKERLSSNEAIGSAGGEAGAGYLQPIAMPTASESLPSYESEPKNLPLPWFSWKHPVDGQVYFYRDSAPRIVTEANIYRPDVMEQIVRWEKRIGDLCHDQCISLSKDVELFLQLDKSDSDHCAYYFIDHGTRTQFWIDDLGPEGPSLPPIASVPYFKLAVEELYWNHVYHFPMHLDDRISKAMEDITFMLSPPDSSKDLLSFEVDGHKQFLEVLQTLPGYISNPYTKWVLPRLWHAVTKHKITMHSELGYGTQPVNCSTEIQGLPILFGNIPSVTKAAVTSPTSSQLKGNSIPRSVELQHLVDAIDQVGLSSNDPFLHQELMVKIMTNTGIIPTKSHLYDVVRTSHPERMTAGTNVFRGVSNGNAVALKKPRHHSRAAGAGAVPADLYREYCVLSMLDHPQILPVLGIFVDPQDFLPAVVSPYMHNGTIDAYLESNPDADRLRLLAEAANGIDYIHNLPNPVIHRDIRSANIMVNAEGNAVVIDFGSSLLLKSGAVYALPSHDNCPGNPRWMAPETLRTGRYPITPKIDVWSFANLGIEVFSGKRPFNDIIRDGAVVLEIVNKNRRPSRPRDVASARQLNDSVWALMEQSWKLDPSHRPSMRDIYLLLSSLAKPVSSD